MNNLSKQNYIIDFIQNNFTIYVFNIHRKSHGSYDNILSYLNFIPHRRLQLLFNFLHKLIYGLIDCPDLLYLIKFKINSCNTRNPELFYPAYSNKDYMFNF